MVSIQFCFWPTIRVVVLGKVTEEILILGPTGQAVDVGKDGENAQKPRVKNALGSEGNCLWLI